MCDDLPAFVMGGAYLVKALDHFTRTNGTNEKLLIAFFGIFVEETEHYFKFVSYFYDEVTKDDLFYSPEMRFVLKCAIESVYNLKLQITGTFEERIMKIKKIEEEIKNV